MPFGIDDALLGAGISAVSSGISNLLNVNTQDSINQRNIDQANQLYAKQRADALSDWNTQNAYNSPSQQMQRFKEAGLNPNLIYGQMSNAPAIRSSDAKQPSLIAPKVDTNIAGQAIGTYFDVKQKDLAIKNQDMALQLAKEDLQGKKLDNALKADSMPYSLEQRYQTSMLTGKNVENIMADIRNKEVINPLQQDAIRSQLKTMQQNRDWQNLSEPQKNAVNKATANLISSKIAGQDISNQIQQYEYDLQKNLGINKNIFGDLLKIALSSLFK